MYPHKYTGDAYIEFCRRGGASIGDNVTVYNALNTIIDETSLHFISIGDNVQITAGVTILAHDYSYSVLGNVYGELPRQQRKTVIGSNVFIGMNSIILMGAQIGDNVIIGAGSVVSGHIPSNTVCAGNPAQIICSLKEFLTRSRERFEESAKCYFNGIKRKNGTVNKQDMIIYQALFSDTDKVKSIIRSSNYCGLGSNTAINMNDYRKYETFEDFLEESE